MAFPAPKRLRAVPDSQVPVAASSSGHADASRVSCSPEELVGTTACFDPQMCDCIAIEHRPDLDVAALQEWADEDVAKLEALPGRYWRINVFNGEPAWKKEAMVVDGDVSHPLYIIWAAMHGCDPGWIVSSNPMAINDETTFAWSSKKASAEKPWPTFFHVPFWSKKKSDMVTSATETCLSSNMPSLFTHIASSPLLRISLQNS